MTGIIKLVHRADHPDGPFKTIGEVAEYFERDRTTIRKWCRRLCDAGYQIPDHKMPLGEEDDNNPNGSQFGAFVWLYTEKDIRELEKFSRDINPKGGRPRKQENVGS